MQIRWHPLIGSLLNIVLFGLPDLLVGRYKYGILKLMFIFFVAPYLVGGIAVYMDHYITANIDFGYWLLLLCYIVAGWDGYRVFASAK